mgnify:CR=1 FL=1
MSNNHKVSEKIPDNVEKSEYKLKYDFWLFLSTKFLSGAAGEEFFNLIFYF